ncbi:MAG: DUF5908 family protein [Rhizomicrobium sp.]
MPLEINEIGIRMRVHDGQPRAGTPEGDGADAGQLADAVASEPGQARDAIVDACVRRVLAALKTMQER